MFPLLAQNNANDPPDEFVFVVLAGVCGFYLVLLIIFVFFLLTLSKALDRCDSRNRTMEPGMVWLNLIPLFNLVWMFITVIRVGESLQNEFYERRWDRRGEDYGKGLGIATCALVLASNIPYIGCIFFLGWFVCFIIYWLKIAGYSNQLETRAYAPADDYEDDYDDEEDRRDRRKRRDRDDRDRDDDDEDGGRKRRPWDRGGR